MSKLRRFHVDSLQGSKDGDSIALPADEARHVRVLRLEPGAEIEVFDSAGYSARGLLEESNATQESDAHVLQIAVRLSIPPKFVTRRRSLVLGVAWPKGKRASLLVEKCSELGVNRIIPVRYLRSVVSKREESEGIARLRRIAAEAAKQCGRNDVPEIAEEVSFQQVLNDAAAHLMLLLDPRAEAHIVQVLCDKSQEFVRDSRPIFLLVGPEGGFSLEELAAAESAAIRRVRLAANVLRVETAAIAACAVTQAILDEEYIVGE